MLQNIFTMLSFLLVAGGAVTLHQKSEIMSKKAWIYSGFFIALIVVFYLVVRKWLAYNDTISVVQPFSFVNQDGKAVTDADMLGKVYVSEFFFTTCTGICPEMNTNMKGVYERFKDNPNFAILSHTSDPERDSVPVLKRYADSMKVNTDKWIFLTGRKDSLYKAARLSYTVDNPANNLQRIEDQFIHTQFWALVNKEGKVKKVYDGLKKDEVNEMVNEIENLLDK
jgi:protein SCO1